MFVCWLEKKKEGIAVAHLLSENDIEIVSSETLLLANSSKVNFLINFMRYILFSNDRESLFNVLCFLYDFLEVTEEKHLFFEKYVHLDIYDFVEEIEQLGVFLIFWNITSFLCTKSGADYSFISTSRNTRCICSIFFR